jgi:hypothetical protein
VALNSFSQLANRLANWLAFLSRLAKWLALGRATLPAERVDGPASLSSSLSRFLSFLSFFFGGWVVERNQSNSTQQPAVGVPRGTWAFGRGKNWPRGETPTTHWGLSMG